MKMYTPAWFHIGPSINRDDIHNYIFTGVICLIHVIIMFPKLRYRPSPPNIIRQLQVKKAKGDNIHKLG